MTPILGQTANRADSRTTSRADQIGQTTVLNCKIVNEKQESRPNDRSRSSPNSHSPDSSFDALLATLGILHSQHFQQQRLPDFCFQL